MALCRLSLRLSPAPAAPPVPDPALILAALHFNRGGPRRLRLAYPGRLLHPCGHPVLRDPRLSACSRSPPASSISCSAVKAQGRGKGWGWGWLGSGPFSAPADGLSGDIIQAGDPVLHEKTAPVAIENIESEEVQGTIDAMIAAMRAAPGVGLSANQIGAPFQILVAEDTEEYMMGCDPQLLKEQQRKPFDLLVIINPVLKPVGNKRARFFEGCLSVPNFRGLVERSVSVHVSGLDRQGRPLSFEAHGWQARVLQHEYDHLQGLLYVDRLVPRSFRTLDHLQMPLAAECPKPGAV